MGLKELLIGEKINQEDLAERCVIFLKGGNPNFSSLEADVANHTIVTLKEIKPQNNEQSISSKIPRELVKVS